MKRTVKYLLIGILTYYIVGFGLFFIGIIKKFPIFFNTVLTVKGNSLENDNSKSSTDGPFVFYRQDSILIKSVVPNDTSFTLYIDTAFEKSNVKLTCNIDNSQSFHFDLQDSLKIQQTEYPLPDKMLVISDIEGNFHGFKSILEGCGIIDRQYNWIFGSGHLVLAGDFFDRGLNVTETLWLVYKLENEAEKAGGKVHFILGNHEMMNLYGNTKYVRKKYFENAKIICEPYKNWFTSDTELGKWLRTKNIIEKIGDIVFLHGGISMDLVNTNLTLTQINQISRQNIGKPLDSIDIENARLIYDTKIGPFWYRGLVKEDVTEEDVDNILKYAKANRLVVGHTIVEDISTFYQNKIIAIDLHHSKNFETSIMKALWIENGSFYIIDNRGTKTKLI